MKTPSEVLAEQVLERLAQSGLVMKEDASKLIRKVALGSMKEEDWRLAIEKPILKVGQ